MEVQLDPNRQLPGKYPINFKKNPPQADNLAQSHYIYTYTNPLTHVYAPKCKEGKSYSSRTF